MYQTSKLTMKWFINLISTTQMKKALDTAIQAISLEVKQAMAIIILSPYLLNKP